MEQIIQMLDCTLRDGAYITNGFFGAPAIKGIIHKLQDANIDIIECGWLKNAEHESGSTYYHKPNDLISYLPARSGKAVLVAMIDWDRYNLSYLPDYDGTSIDAIRIVFPHGKIREAAAIAKIIQNKGYKCYFQIANTLAYSNAELEELSEVINKIHPVSVSVVDTFGAMYEEDLDRIVSVLNEYLEEDICLGFHSHNNQQLSFALTMHFVDILKGEKRNLIVDSSLCGMGRGAGNATTELVASFLNRKHHGNYDMNAVMDAIDLYMEPFQQKYTWGYSTQYMIAGMYCCHVNNIAYLMENHRSSARDMRNIIESMPEEDRRRYDYDLLENMYLQNQSHQIDDEKNVDNLRELLTGRKVLLIAPGKTSQNEQDRIRTIIRKEGPYVLGVNAILPFYQYDSVFFVNAARYTYASEAYAEIFDRTNRILLSNIKTVACEKETIISFERVIKRGWPHFDNAVICALRLMDMLEIEDVMLAGFDGFQPRYNDSYADQNLPTLNTENRWDDLNREIFDMFQDFQKSAGKHMRIRFVTESLFEHTIQN